MKKVFILALLAMVAIASASYAVTPGKVSLGVDTAGASSSVANVAAMVLRYNFTDSLTGQLGLNYSNGKPQGGAESNSTGYGVRVNYYIPKTFGAANPYVGVQYSSDGAATATTILSLLLGVETEVSDGVTAGAGIIPYSAATTGGASDSSINTGTDLQTGGTRAVFISLGFNLN